MNILPKKSWHVRTKRNIERVRRDEAKAAAEERIKQERKLLAEQEARTAYLRAKASKSVPEEARSARSTVDDSKKHVNFFEDIEEQGKYFGKVNKEHEEEKKAEQEKFEKQIGLLTYLGQSALESNGTQPWYIKSPSERMHNEDDSEKTLSKERKRALLDPLNDIRQYLDQTKKPHKDETVKSSKQKYDKKESPSSACVLKSRHKHKHKKHKKEKKSKREIVKNVLKNDGDIAKKSLEELRRERLERERAERKRAEELLAKHRGQTSTETPQEVPVDERHQRYNSQFNPHLARQNIQQ